MNWLDVAVAVTVYVLACVAAWLVAGFVLDYDLVARDTGRTGHLPYAYAVGWLGIAVTVMIVPLWMLRAVRLRQPAWPTALLAFPMLALAWVLGLLTAIFAA